MGGAGAEFHRAEAGELVSPSGATWTVQVGGASSSGLARDSQGRQINSPVDGGTTGMENSTTGMGNSTTGMQNLNEQPAWNQTGSRVRLSRKTREVVDHRQALGPEPMLTGAEQEMLAEDPDGDLVE